MKGHGPRFERETIINFNDDSNDATIWTASETIYKRLLKRLGYAFLTEDGERHAIFTFPISFLVLPRAKSKRVLNPTQRQALVNQLAKRP